VRWPFWSLRALMRAGARARWPSWRLRAPMWPARGLVAVLEARGADVAGARPRWRSWRLRARRWAWWRIQDASVPGASGR
jgi:hypothetical protein